MIFLSPSRYNETCGYCFVLKCIVVFPASETSGLVYDFVEKQSEKKIVNCFASFMAFKICSSFLVLAG